MDLIIDTKDRGTVFTSLRWLVSIFLATLPNIFPCILFTAIMPTHSCPPKVAIIFHNAPPSHILFLLPSSPCLSNSYSCFSVPLRTLFFPPSIGSFIILSFVVLFCIGYASLTHGITWYYHYLCTCQFPSWACKHFEGSDCDLLNLAPRLIHGKVLNKPWSNGRMVTCTFPGCFILYLGWKTKHVSYCRRPFLELPSP